MNRKNTTSENENGCIILRKYYDHPAITTDVIVGFPGETEEEFNNTKEFLERIHFYEMHIFKYSKRQGTRAATMENQVPEEIKTKRSAQLISLGNKMSKEFRDYYLGQEQEVLFEEKTIINSKEMYIGYTKEYVKVAVESERMLENQLVKGKITGFADDNVYIMESIH